VYGARNDESRIATSGTDEDQALLQNIVGSPSTAQESVGGGQSNGRPSEGVIVYGAAAIVSGIAIPSNYLFTVHGTVLYVDPASGELRHGPPESSRINASLVSDGARGQILCEAAGARQPIVCLLDRCQTLERANRRDGPFTPTIFEVVSLDAGTVGLKARGVFLCAEADGRVTLSRLMCGEWEKFYLGARASAVAETAVPETAVPFHP
jgi:hypothetical protein